MKSLSTQEVATFRKTIWSHYKKHGRRFPWRETNDPYKILVSEIMLQQTQTYRVEPKYHSFLKKFPTIKKLAQASLGDVLTEWKGLGYNRRGKALHDIARILVNEKRAIPRTLEELDALPSIGPNTAASISAFAYNMSVVFIETNIRTVFIHHFFNDKKKVGDSAILELVGKTLDKTNPREWYLALMDYGNFLKKEVGNLNRTKSVHYRKQAPFKGSNRELRSKILDLIREGKDTSTKLSQVDLDTKKIQKNIDDLLKEGFIVKKGRTYSIKNKVYGII